MANEVLEIVLVGLELWVGLQSGDVALGVFVGNGRGIQHVLFGAELVLRVPAVVEVFGTTRFIHLFLYEVFKVRLY